MQWKNFGEEKYSKAILHSNKNLQSLEDTQGGYISQKYTVEKYNF